MKCVVCNLKFIGRIFPSLFESNWSEWILGLWGLPQGDTPLLWYQRWDCSWQTRCSECVRQASTLVWSCAFLLLLPFYRVQESLKDELGLLFPKRQTSVGIARMTEAGITWGEPWHNCCWAWLGERLGSDSPVLYFALLQPVCSAKGSPMHVLVHRGDKMEVISSKGSYKDECTKYSVSCSEDSAKHYSKWRHQLQNSSQYEVTPGIYRWLLRCEWGIFPGLALSLYWFAKGQKLEFSQSCASFLLKSKCLVIWTLGKRKACVIKQTVLLKHKSCN